MDRVIPSSVVPDISDIQKLIARQDRELSLQQEFYTDPGVFQHDMERIFGRHWTIAGHIGSIPKPGDFFLTEIASESIIIARGQDSKIRALANVCRHRGANVCAEKSGNRRVFSCPYHGWTYANDGKLVSARHMGDGFDKSQYRLKEVQLRVIQGLIFITLADEPLGTTRLEETLNAGFGPYDWTSAKVAAREIYRVDANWKLTVENYVECYHCAPAHPEYSMLHAIERPPEQIEGMYSRLNDRARELGIAIDSVSHWHGSATGEEAAYRLRYPLTDGVETGSRDGKRVAPLMGSFKEFDGGATSIHCGPSSFCLAYPDHGVIYRFIPRDLQWSDMEAIWLVRSDAIEGRDYNLDELTWLWRVTLDADKAIIQANQRGVNSRYYEPGPFAPMETNEKRYVNWYLNEIG